MRKWFFLAVALLVVLLASVLLINTLRYTSRQILFMGHQDVVPVEEETLTDWEEPPFEGRIAGEYVWGRGSMDDKFAVLGVMEAVETLLAHGFQPKHTVYLAFGHDEEGRIALPPGSQRRRL